VGNDGLFGMSIELKCKYLLLTEVDNLNASVYISIGASPAFSRAWQLLASDDRAVKRLLYTSDGRDFPNWITDDNTLDIIP
jgi:hypothetical protein